jgi:hypothetical protein
MRAIAWIVPVHFAPLFAAVRRDRAQHHQHRFRHLNQLLRRHQLPLLHQHRHQRRHQHRRQRQRQHRAPTTASTSELTNSAPISFVTSSSSSSSPTTSSTSPSDEPVMPIPTQTTLATSTSTSIDNTNDTTLTVVSISTTTPVQITDNVANNDEREPVNWPLIGGIVGAVLCLLIIVNIITVLVCVVRRRRRDRAEDQVEAATAASTTERPSSYFDTDSKSTPTPTPQYSSEYASTASTLSNYSIKGSMPQPRGPAEPTNYTSLPQRPADYDSTIVQQ